MSRPEGRGHLPPSPAKLRRARYHGNVPRSRVLSSAAGLVGLFVAAWIGFDRWWSDLGELMMLSLLAARHGQIDTSVIETLASAAGVVILWPCLVVLAGVLISTVASGLVWSPGAFTRGSPRDGSRPWLAAWGAALVLLVVVAFRLFDDAAGLASLPSRPLERSVPQLGTWLVIGAGSVVLTLLVAGLAHWLWVRWRWWRALRMTHAEKQRERQEQELPPAIRRQLVRKRRRHP